MYQNLISRYRSRLHDFWYEAPKKVKKNARDNGLRGWNDVAVTGISNRYTSRKIYGHNILRT
jgi:hypothetical protein